MNRRLVAFIVTLIPLAAGFTIATLFERDILSNRVIVGRYAVDLAWLSSWIGILVSVVLLSLLVRRWFYDRQMAQVRREEKAVQMANKRQFLQRLDHELKNPLTIIRLGVANWQHDPDLTPEQVVSLQRVGQQAERLQKLVIDLRQLTELEAYRLEKRPVDLREVLQEAIDASTPDRRNHKVELQVQEVPWPLGGVLGDRDLLVTALRNVVSNALRYTQEDGAVEIRATDDGRTVTIEVADNGIGIPADALHHVFEELYRGQNAKQVSGSGLGLSLVQKIIGMHGGTISIRSRETQGTVVTVQLPLASAE